jgi:O-antigen/teichoic acid export membrane protein
VPVSQVLLALSGYVLLALAARTMPAAGFAAISAFYLLLNTVGRGVFASVELETNRALAAADAAGEDGRPVLSTAARRAALLLVAAIALSLAATPLLPDFEVACALALGSCTMAISYCVRGPLAARRRFPAYSATFLLEGGFTLGGAAGLAIGHVDAVAAWAAVLVLSPGVAAVLVALRASRAGLFTRVVGLWSAGGRASTHASVHRISLAALIWTSLFYLSSQGVWNLGPVSVTSALSAVPTEAAGFVAVAVILRAPVFVFPAIQAVLLPSVSAAAQRDDREGTRRTLRPLLLLLGAVAVPWMLAAVLVVPWLARLAFAVQDVPPWPATAALGASTLVGAAAFVLQTRVLAFRRHRDVGLAWLAGLCTLGLVSLVPGDPRLWAALAQLAAAIVVVGGVLVADRRVGRAATRIG